MKIKNKEFEFKSRFFTEKNILTLPVEVMCVDKKLGLCSRKYDSLKDLENSEENMDVLVGAFARRAGDTLTIEFRDSDAIEFYVN